MKRIKFGKEIIVNAKDRYLMSVIKMKDGTSGKSYFRILSEDNEIEDLDGSYRVKLKEVYVRDDNKVIVHQGKRIGNIFKVKTEPLKTYELTKDEWDKALDTAISSTAKFVKQNFELS